ncbi:hypothetical protein Pla110_05470 [Polystyrenella longa]|uniref:Uncharacterized protein n=1 Tax=Polystyrenella longa TaxID=2528007 RepID=A0A518CHY8_9PLAN|nr:hypothetical protein [Polystyrenella longa]QDU78843.1 hypothetical protein Pla110_05470 [Polystyrenella longa]
MSDLTCTKCGAALQENDFNLDLGVARCSYCNAWTRLGEALSLNLESEATRIKKEVGAPDNYEINEYHGVLHITWKWFNWGILFLVFFCVIWDGFLVVWYFIAATQGMDGKFSLIAFLFPLLHVAVGALLTYYTIASLFNRTTILVGDHRLSIKHGPIPWKGVELRDTGDLDQLFVEEKVNRSKNGTSYTYLLKAKLHSGSELKLITNLASLQEGLFLEQKIEEFLKIEDRRMAGEVSP